ncbi:histone acetyltransferase Hpa2p [[Candida] railenensis]|uniref:Histone acetyltransferase Hpa2p n=1 Tax=[Candida] railenensis TaxID=45579 RepID=A0A9P0W1J2_9ASCO|nr:histone acetyltransferase Hpa2p [[Candida] railenensis]
MSVTIRKIQEGDKEEWTNLWSGAGGYLEFYKSTVPEKVTETTFKRFFDDKDPVYSAVAVDDSTGKIIGFANYLTHRNTWTIGDSLYLNDLFVSNDCRLKGTGRKLVEFVYTEADKFGCENTYWHTQFENHRAQLLYTKVGYKAGFLVYKRPKE